MDATRKPPAGLMWRTVSIEARTASPCSCARSYNTVARQPGCSTIVAAAGREHLAAAALPAGPLQQRVRFFCSDRKRLKIPQTFAHTKAFCSDCARPAQAVCAPTAGILIVSIIATLWPGSDTSSSSASLFAAHPPSVHASSGKPAPVLTGPAQIWLHSSRPCHLPLS